MSAGVSVLGSGFVVRGSGSRFRVPVRRSRFGIGASTRLGDVSRTRSWTERRDRSDDQEPETWNLNLNLNLNLEPRTGTSNPEPEPRTTNLEPRTD
jgi:hypothetical protein